MPEDLGFDMLDGARESFRMCPRCNATAVVIHREPMSGGGVSRHEHHCTRCRHEWEADPATYLLCPYPDCDHHGRDRTGQVGHEALVSRLFTGPIPQDMIAAARILGREIGVDPVVAEEVPDELVALLRAMSPRAGHQPRVLTHWLHALSWKNRKNPAFGGIPVDLFRTAEGRQILRNYLEQKFPA